MREQIIAGNWKLNGTIAETEKLLGELGAKSWDSDRVTVLVCPPFTAIAIAAQSVKGKSVAVGGQDMSLHESGAYTAEVSADMLLTAGATHVILGHSERRQYHAETDQLVNAKAKVALAKGLTPIICVGETLDQRESGETETVIGQQIERTLIGFSTDMLKKSVIAYEPVWAIGTGKTATPEMAQTVHKFIREKVASVDGVAAEQVPILYGGSVKPGNAGDLLSQPDIDGALVGGASLKADDFAGIIDAV